MNLAELARDYWLENALDEYDYILLLPCSDDRLSDTILSVFKKMLKSKRYNAAIVLAPFSIKENICYDVRLISEKLFEGLIALYTMYEFTDKLIVGSFDLPHERKFKNLLDCGIGSKKELVESVIFGI